MSGFKLIDVASWNRKDHYKFFKDFDLPFFNVTVNVDVTKLLQRSREEKFSFFLASLHCTQLAVHLIEPFRYRIKDDQVICYDSVHPGTTAIDEDKVFKYTYLKHMSGMSDFIAQAEMDLKQQLSWPGLSPNSGLDVIYYSSMPWVSFTSFQHARQFSKGDSIPRIVFGKYFHENGKYKMPISIEVNHALMDGYHVGVLVESVQKILDD